MNAVVPRPSEAEILAPGEGTVTVIAALHPLRVRRQTFELPAGLSIWELLDLIPAPSRVPPSARVWIGRFEVPRRLWGQVRPKPGVTVSISVVPQGGEGLRLALIIAVVIAVAVFAPYLEPVLLGAGLSPALAAGVSAGIGAAVTIGAILAINALVPIGEPQLDSNRSPTFFLEGARNTARFFRPVPEVLGVHRQVPPLGALTFTEVVGKDQWLNMLVIWGYGPMQIDNIRIAETPIGDFDGAQVETLQGFPGDPPLSLITDQVFEDNPGVLLDFVSGWTSRTSQPDADCLSVDFTFLKGLVFIGGSGDRVLYDATFEIQFRLVGAGSWSDVTQAMFDSGTATFPDSWFVAGSPSQITFVDRSESVVRHALRWDPGAQGQYEVQIRRVSADDTVNRVSECTWTAFRTITNTDPVVLSGLAKTALRLKATGELNGIVDQLNGDCSRLIRDWNGATWDADQITSNPASLFRHVCQGPANPEPLADSRVDLTALEAWHDFCVTEGFTFNQVIDFDTSVEEVLRAIAGAGRASLTRIDGLWGVVIDEPQATPVQAFTPRTSRDYRGERAFLDQPHALRVGFLNEEKDYRRDERIVYADNFDAGSATRFETVEYPGITDPDHIWKRGRYDMAVAIQRPERHSFVTDIEHLQATFGDRIELNHDVPVAGLGYGRIKSITDNGTHATDLILDDLVTYEVGKSYGCRVRYDDFSQRVFALDNIGGETATLTLTTPEPLATAPAVGDQVMFGETGAESLALKILGIEPADDLAARLICLPYGPAVYTADQGTIPPFSSLLGTIPGLLTPSVIQIRSDETVLVIGADGTQSPRILVTFGYVSNRSFSSLAAIEGQIRRTGSNTAWQSQLTADPAAVNIFFDVVEQGESYDLRFRFIDVNGQPGPFTTVFTETVVGDGAPPPAPATFTVARKPDGTREFVWTHATPTPFDVLIGGGVKIRWFLGATADWTAMTDLHAGLLSVSPFETNQLAAGTYTFAAKTVDASGNESATALFINQAVLGDPRLRNVLLTRDEKTLGWPGTKTACFVAYENVLEAVAAAGQDWLVLPGTWSALNDKFKDIVESADPISYETPVLDVTVDTSFTPLVTAAGETTLTTEMRTATSAEGSDLSAKPYVALGEVTGKRYLQIRVTAQGT